MDDISEFDFRFFGWCIEEGEGVLHPCVVKSLSEVISGMCTSRLFSVLSGVHGHLGLDHEVLELHSLNQVGVPDVATIANTDICNALGGLVESLATLLKIILSTENGGIFLHGLLHLATDLGSGGATSGESQAVEVGDALLASGG